MSGARQEANTATVAVFQWRRRREALNLRVEAKVGGKSAELKVLLWRIGILVKDRI